MRTYTGVWTLVTCSAKLLKLPGTSKDHSADIHLFSPFISVVGSWLSIRCPAQTDQTAWMDRKHKLFGAHMSLCRFLAHMSWRLVGELIVQAGIHRPSVIVHQSSWSSTSSNDISWSQEANSCHISHVASTSRGNELYWFLSQSDKKSGCYGNL